MWSNTSYDDPDLKYSNRIFPCDTLSQQGLMPLDDDMKLQNLSLIKEFIVQELCESHGGHPGLSVLTSLLVSVDVKLY